MSKKIIELENLSYSYPDGVKALDNITLDVFEGECLGVIGPNGAGKSTLLLHLNGILRGEGKIRISGLDMAQNLSKIRAKVGLVFQNPDHQLFMPNVFDDVAFGPMNMGFSKDKIKEAVRKALGQVDMQGFENRLSHHLSFGEKKRLSIATVLSMNPEILVLDEPSSNLDPHRRRDLINFLKEFKLTKLVATHDLDLVLEVCSRVVLLDKGRLAAEGEVLTLLKDRALLESHDLELPASLCLPR